MPFHTYAATAEIISDKLPKVSDPDDILIVTRLNESVSAFVDTYCKRSDAYFSPSPATVTTRFFRGEGKNFLRISRHIDGSITVINANVDSSQWYEGYENGWLYAKDAQASNYDEHFDRTVNFWKLGIQFELTGRWGYEQIPADISEAVKQIVAKYFDVSQGVLGEVTPQGFVIERDAPKSALMLLGGFIRPEYEV